MPPLGRLCAFLVFAVASAAPAVGADGAVTSRVALRAARLVDGRSDAVRRDAVVVVEGERILAVGGAELLAPGIETIDLGDATLLPGLVDAHSHPLIWSDDYQVEHLKLSSAAKAL